MRLSRILAIALVVGCGSAEQAPSAESAPAELEDEAVVLDEPAAPAPTPAEELDPEALGVEAVPREIVEPEAEPEAIQIGQDAVEPAPRVHRRPRSGGARAPSGAPGGDAVYDIEE